MISLFCGFIFISFSQYWACTLNLKTRVFLQLCQFPHFFFQTAFFWYSFSFFGHVLESLSLPSLFLNCSFVYNLYVHLCVHVYTHTWASHSLVYSIQFSHSVMSDSLWPQDCSTCMSPPCPSPTPGVYSNSSPLSQWCHPTISSSVVPFSSCLQSFPASGSFPMSQFFASGGQSIAVLASASVLPMNIPDWLPSGWTGWIYNIWSEFFPAIPSLETTYQVFLWQWYTSHFYY